MDRHKATKAVAAVAALVGWASLALQLVLVVGKLGPGRGAWRFLGYFTILTNVGAAVVASAVALGRDRGLGGARARLMAAVSIGLVGIIYSVALRALWSPTGWQKVADSALHDVTPLLFLGMWAIGPHGKLGRKDFAWALVPPALYAAYALARGAIDGWYAYWFLDPSKQSVAELTVSVAVMLVGVAVVAGVLVAVDRWFAKGSSRWR